MRILAIVDSYNWALANRARNLSRNFKNHKFDIKYFRDLKNIKFSDYNVVYVLNWPIHGYIHKKIDKNRKYRLVTSVSSHIGRKNASSLASMMRSYDAISASNMFLYKEFKNIYKNKVFYTPFGVNSEIFKPETNPADFKKVFGWVGNHKRSVKRFKVIQEAFKELGDDYQLKTVRASSGLNRKQMNDFYNSTGTIICFSLSEGTPNPILEAASAGRSIISTRVGNVPELTRGLKNVQIIKNKKELKRSIKFLLENPNIIRKNGEDLRKRVDSYWSWEHRSKSFKDFLKI